MYYSETLFKEYKTKAAAKGQLTKALNEVNETLLEIETMISRGSMYYLGEPIFIKRREYDREQVLIIKELKSLAQ
jgi:hypothetical protein